MNKVDKVFDYLFSEIIQKKFEKFILFLATAGFIIHLLLIYLNKYDVINFTFNNSLLLNPISALYTPFSFILVYEAFLLIYFIIQQKTEIEKIFHVNLCALFKLNRF